MNLPPARTNTSRNTSLSSTAVAGHRSLAPPLVFLSLETLARFSIQCSFSEELPNEDPSVDDPAGLLRFCSAVRIASSSRSGEYCERPIARIFPALTSASIAPRVVGERRLGSLPPRISCCVCTKNSISRMPPRPSFMLWPATTSFSWPAWAWICRLIEWMSSIAA